MASVAFFTPGVFLFSVTLTLKDATRIWLLWGNFKHNYYKEVLVRKFGFTLTADTALETQKNFYVHATPTVVLTPKSVNLFYHTHTLCILCIAHVLHELSFLFSSSIIIFIVLSVIP